MKSLFSCIYDYIRPGKMVLDIFEDFNEFDIFVDMGAIIWNQWILLILSLQLGTDCKMLWKNKLLESLLRIISLRVNNVIYYLLLALTKDKHMSLYVGGKIKLNNKW